MTENNISESMIFFSSIKDCADALHLSDKEKVEYYEGIINYGLYGIQPDFSNPSLSAIFLALKPNIDANNRKKRRSAICSENGKKGGAPKGNANACKSKTGKNKTSKKTSPKTTIDIDRDVDRDVDVDRDIDADVEKETKDISFISSYSSSKEKEKEIKVVCSGNNDTHNDEDISNHEPDDSNIPDESGNKTDTSPIDNNTNIDLNNRNNAFYQSLVPYVDSYGTEAIQQFYDYWSETDPSGSSMRFELERTWDLEYRLERWIRKRNLLKL